MYLVIYLNGKKERIISLSNLKAKLIFANQFLTWSLFSISCLMMFYRQPRHRAISKSLYGILQSRKVVSRKTLKFKFSITQVSWSTLVSFHNIPQAQMLLNASFWLVQQIGQCWTITRKNGLHFMMGNQCCFTWTMTWTWSDAHGTIFNVTSCTVLVWEEQ